MTDNRPSKLSYRAKDGVIETHIGSIEALQGSLQKFIERAIKWSKNEQEKSDKLIEKYRYRLLDSFMTDAISDDNLERIFENYQKVPIQILLAHPDSQFASIRARARYENREPKTTAWELCKQGLIGIAKALSKNNSIPLSKNISISEIEDKDAIAVLKRLQGMMKTDEFEIRFYTGSPGSPLYFLQDLVLVGRFGTGTSSARLRWEMIVDDPPIDNDVYDTLLREFELLWKESSINLENLFQVPLLSGDLPQVFISHSTKDKELAEELQQKFENKKIKAYVAELDIKPGEAWSEEIRQNLFSCQELVLLLNQESAKSAWVMAECGAAWVLNKSITPATIGFPIENIPLQFIKTQQSVEISTEKGKESLISAVCSRLLHS